MSNHSARKCFKRSTIKRYSTESTQSPSLDEGRYNEPHIPEKLLHQTICHSQSNLMCGQNLNWIARKWGKPSSQYNEVISNLDFVFLFTPVKVHQGVGPLCVDSRWFQTLIKFLNWLWRCSINLLADSTQTFLTWLSYFRQLLFRVLREIKCKWIG